MGRPKVPDLIAAQTQQGEINKGAMDYTTGQNRYQQYGPEGSSNVWGTDPTTGQPTNTTTMGAKPQAYYDALMGGGTGATNSFMDKYYGGGAAAPAAGGGSPIIQVGMPQGNDPNSPVNKGIMKNLNLSGLSAMPGEDIGKARQEAQDALYGRSTGYLDPQWQQQEAATRTRLSNQGLVPGTAAYNNAYANEQAAKEKAYTGARQDAIAGGGAEAARAQEMALQLRNQGFTEEQAKFMAHNSAQSQGADQYLKKYGYDTGLAGQLGAAGISAGASMSNNANNLAAEMGLKTRQQEFAEMMGMGHQAQEFLPQFGISQGTAQPYRPADIAGATQAQYEDEMSRYKAKKPGLFDQLLPVAGNIAGSWARGGFKTPGG